MEPKIKKKIIGKLLGLIKNIWSSKIMQKVVIPPMFTIGLSACIYFGVCFFITGCDSVNESLVKAAKVHVDAIATDYEKLLKHENSTAFVGFKKKDDGTWLRYEIVDAVEREKLQASHWRSMTELQRLLNEQLEPKKGE